MPRFTKRTPLSGAIGFVFSNWWQEIRFAGRTLVRERGFALVGILAFALGIGATTTIFSVVDTVLLRPVPFRDPGSLIQIEERGADQEWGGLVPDDFNQLRSRGELFQSLAAARISLFTVTHVPEPEQMFGRAVTGNLFPMLGAKPLLGRVLTSSDETQNAPNVVVLSYQAWRHLVHGDDGAVNRSIVMDGKRIRWWALCHKASISRRY